MAVAITQTADPASTGVSVAGSVGTYSSVSIGTATSDRIVVLCVGTLVASGTIDSATIDSGGGAVAMKPLAQSTLGSNSARLFWLNVTSGTTATFAITFGATPTTTNQHITVYGVTGAYLTVSSGSNQSTDMDSTTPLHAIFDPTASAIAWFSNIPTSGGFIGAASCATSGTGKTWAGATEDLDEDVGGVFRWTTATSITGANAEIKCTGGTNGEDGAMSWAVFCPNGGSFGDLKAIGGNGTISITNPFQPRAPIQLEIGDLVVVNFVEQTANTITGVTDDLGHTGTALANSTAYYYVATSAGNATISAACTASTHNAALTVCVYAGPFDATPLDKNPAVVSDVGGEPYSCNATGTLSQADELLVGYFSSSNINSNAWDAPSAGSNIGVQSVDASNLVSAAQTYQVVSSTTTVTLTIGGTGSAIGVLCGVATFKKSSGVAAGGFGALLSHTRSRMVGGGLILTARPRRRRKKQRLILPPQYRSKRGDMTLS